MSGVTYVLLTAVLYGAAGQFNPSVISSVCTSCLLWQCVTVAAMRCALYVMVDQKQNPYSTTSASVNSVTVLDLFCYAGYQYTGLCWTALVAVLLRQLGFQGGIQTYYYVALAYTATATAFFLFRTFSAVLPPRSPAVLAIALGASSYLTMWLVSPTRVL